MTRKAPPRVAVVLVSWNSRADTLECLESVFRLRYPNFRVVLCDNASNDGLVEAAEAWAAAHASNVVPASPHFAPLLSARPRMTPVSCVRLDRPTAETSIASTNAAPPALTVIQTGSNLGFAGGNNVGIRYALRCLEVDFLWLLNTDTVVDPGALDELVGRALLEPDVGMVGSSLIFYWFPDTVQALGGARIDRRNMRTTHIGDGTAVSDIPNEFAMVERDLAYVVGASMLVSKDLVEQVGLMNESYFLYYEELDWAERAAGQFRLAYAPRSVVYHKVGGASRRIASLASARYMWRNRIRFGARFLPDSMPSILRLMVVEMLRAFLRGRFVAARAIAGALLERQRLCKEGAHMDLGGRLS